MLVKYSVDLDAQDCDMNTALHYAIGMASWLDYGCKYGAPESTKRGATWRGSEIRLLRSGVYPKAKDRLVDDIIIIPLRGWGCLRFLA